MQAPYKECSTCIATPWCKRYSGESPKPESPAWCNPKYRLDKALKMTNIPKRYLKANKANYKADSDNVENAKRLKPYLENILEEIEYGKNFLFRGMVPGTGKTFHAAMLLNEYVYKACLTSRMDFENPLAYFISYADLMDELRYNTDKDYVATLMEKVKNVPLLLLDDLGAGTTSDFTNEQTFILVNYRFNNELSTIFTSNLDKVELSKKLNPRIVSRILNDVEDLKFESKFDRRMN